MSELKNEYTSKQCRLVPHSKIFFLKSHISPRLGYGSKSHFSKLDSNKKVEKSFSNFINSFFLLPTQPKHSQRRIFVYKMFVAGKKKQSKKG